jgi:PAS domain S-box-containing protein
MASAGSFPSDQRSGSCSVSPSTGEAFDQSAALAAELFGVPLAVVASGPPDRREVLAAGGGSDEKAEQALPFCAPVSRAEGLMVIENLRAHARFADHPLVTEDSGIRYLAGVPLTGAEGETLGAFLILGTGPDVPSKAELRPLERLAAVTSETLVLRRAATAREDTEETLRKMQRRCHTLVEQFPDGGVFLFDHNLQCILAGGTEISEVGLTAEEIEGATPRDLYPPRIADEHEEHFRATLRGEQRVYEQTYQGEHYRIRTAPVRDAEGKITAGMAISKNVTERREAQRRLEKSEQRYRTLTEHFPNGAVGVYDHDLRYTLAGGAELGEGLPTAAELEGCRMPALFPDETVADLEPLFRAAVEEGATGSAETTFNDRDWKVWAAPLRDAEGNIFAGLSFAQDVTERKERERDLERTMTLLTLAEEMADVGGWSVDVSDESLFGAEWTDNLHDILGIPPDETPPIERVIGLYQLEDQVRHRRAIDRAVKTGEGWDQEIRLVTSNGVERWVHNVGEPVTENGEVVEIHGMIQDITERKRREHELRAAKEEAEEASRLKSSMLANMSHEIRTPLTSITGFSEILKENLEGELATFAEKTYASSQRLMKTLDSVLQLSKLEAGVLTLGRELVSLNAVVDETVEMLQPVAAKKPVVVEAHLPDEPVDGHWSEGALNRIVGNLVENAIKFTPADGQVEVRVREEAAEAVLEVEDTGIGIGEAFQDRMFEAFRQESSGVRREYEGSGLGLSIVHRLVDVLGGRIEVESEKNVGTCFTVWLPQEYTSGEVDG